MQYSNSQQAGLHALRFPCGVAPRKRTGNDWHSYEVFKRKLLRIHLPLSVEEIDARLRAYFRQMGL